MTTLRPRRWRRRILWLAAIVVGARLLLAAGLPWLVDLAARQIGCAAAYRSASLSLLGLSLHLEDLTVRDRAEASSPPLLTIQELTADVSTWHLLHGEFVLVDAAVSGGRLQLRRGNDGDLVLPAPLRSPPAVAPTPAGSAPAAPFAGTFAPASLVLPFQIASARVHDLQLLYTDELATPARTMSATLDVDASDVGRRDRSGHLTVRVHSPDHLETLRLVASSTMAPDQASVQWQLTVQGIHLEPLPLPPDLRTLCAGASQASGELAGTFTAARQGAAGDPFTMTAELQGAVLLDAIEQVRVRATVGPATLAAAHAAVPFQLELHGQDFVDRLRVEGGQIELSKAQVKGSAALDCRGLTLRRLQPWLQDAGVTMATAGVDATARLQFELDPRATGALSARLENVTLRHGDERIALQSVVVTDLAGSATQGLVVGALEIHGPELAIDRLADGTIAVAGLRLRRPTSPGAAAAPAQQATAAAPTSPPSPAPGVLLRRFAWRDASLRFRDDTLPGKPVLSIAELAVVGEDLGFGSNRLPGHALATLRLPGSVESVRLDVRTRPTRDGLGADLSFVASGLKGQGLAPWLHAAGCDPLWQNANLALSATVDLGLQPDLTLTGRIANVRLQDGDQVLLGLRNLELQGLRLPAQPDTPDGIDLGSLRVDEPRLLVQRLPDGTQSFAGLRFRAPSTATAPAPAAAAAASPRWHSGPFVLRGAQVFLHHDAGAAAVLGLDAELGPHRQDGSPTTFATTLRIDQAIEALELRGNFSAGQGRLQADAACTGRGLRGAGLTAWLPDGMIATFGDGSLQARIAAQVRSDAGSTGIDLVLADLWLRDGTEELAALERLELHAPTLSAALLHLQSLQVQGLRALATQTADGLHLPGLLLRPAAIPQPAPATTAATASTAAPRGPMPALRCDQFDVAIERLVYRDRRGGDHEPLTLAARLQLQSPWATTAALADSPPLDLLLTGAAPPLCQQARIQVQLQPFDKAPWVDLSVHAEGLDPTALARIAPGLGARLGGTTTAASLRTKMHGRLDLRRRDPTQFDFRKPFGGQLHLDQLELRDANGAELASIASIEVVARAIDLQTGDVLLKSIDIDAPVVHASRTADGLELAGLLLRNPPPSEAAPVTTVPAPAAASAGAEFAVDRLRIQGLRTSWRDATTSPPTDLPIDELDLEVQRFSTRLLHEPEPFGFQLSVRGGDLALPRRVHRSSMLAGLVGSAAQAAVGGRDQHDMERRPLFQDLTATGQLQLYPLPKGTCRVDLTGFEMAAVRGLASQGGVVINDGTFDASATADLGAGAGTKLKAGLTFTWLSMSEPPNGPISTYLKLPAPLESVLFLLRNDADEQRLPFQLHLPASGIQPARIAEAAVEALTLLIADSIRTSPFRLAGTVTSLLDFGPPSGVIGQATALACTSGGGLPDLTTLAPLLALTAADPELKFVLVHELGAGDLQRAEALANPAPEVVTAAIARLRAHRNELALRRDDLAAAATAAYAAARPDAPVAFARLQEVAEELGGTEASLDAALARLDVTSARDRQRYARKAAQALAEQRLAQVRAAVAASLPVDASDRIEVRTPRTLVAEGLPEGGRVVVTVRRRAPATDQRR